MPCTATLPIDVTPAAPVPAPAAAPAGSDPWLARLRAGDEAAFEELIRRYGGRLLATARRLLRDEAQAQDAVQDAFVSALRKLDGFRGDSQVATWLHRIVVNAALMRIRTQQRRRERSIEDLLPAFGPDGSWAEDPHATTLQPEAALIANETRDRVRAAIDQLPALYREVLILRDIEELDTQQVAAIVGATPNAVKIRLHRARQALRTLLAT